MRPVMTILAIMVLVAPALASDPPPLITSWGGPGSGPAQFNHPSDVALAPNGDVYVVDSDNFRVQYFTSSGSYLGEWGAYGTQPGQFQRPHGIAIDGWGNVYVTDSVLGRVQKFTPDGQYLATFANEHIPRAAGIAVDPDGNLYVGNLGTLGVVSKFDAAGAFLMTFKSMIGWGVDLDSHGCVFVSNEIPCVQRFAADGTRTASWGCGFSFEEATLGLAVDDLDNVLFVLSYEPDAVVICDHELRGVDFWAPPAPPAGLHPGLEGIAAGSDGLVYLTDFRNNVILKVRYSVPVRTVISTWGWLKSMYHSGDHAD